MDATLCFALKRGSLNTEGFGQFPHQHYNLRGTWHGTPAAQPTDTEGLLPTAELGAKAVFKVRKCIFTGKNKTQTGEGPLF